MRLPLSGAIPRARNPLVVQGLTWLGFMDERGSGIRWMKRIMELAGQLPPRFTEEHGGVTAELESVAVVGTTPPATSEGAMPTAGGERLADNVAAILAIVDGLGHATTAICVQKLGIARDTAWRTLARLVEDGILVKTGTGRGTLSGHRQADGHRDHRDAPLRGWPGRGGLDVLGQRRRADPARVLADVRSAAT
jgi:predicted HTH transcriptional regulator